MKDNEEKLVDQINDLKKKLVQDKKNKGKPSKNTPDDSKKISDQKPKHSFAKVFMTSLPFLIIIAFIVGFFAGSSYEKNNLVNDFENLPVNTGSEGQQNTQSDSQSQDSQQQTITTPEPPKECFDTDSGIKQFEQGQVFFGTALFTDSCRNSTSLVEYYCTEDNTSRNTNIDCDVCEDGACVNFQIRDTGCKESDNYVDFNKKGFVIDKKGRIYEDSCSQVSLEEYYCDSYGFGSTTYTLCDVCENGRCVNEEKKRDCKDSDNGISYYTKGIVLDASGKTGEDKCNGRVLEEFYCSETGYLARSFKLCNQCVEGQCFSS